MNIIRVCIKKIRDVALLLWCATIIAWNSLIILIRLKRVKSPREFINRHTHRAAIQILKTLKVKYQVFIKKPLDFTPNDFYIYMSNHQSHMDLILIFASIPGTIRLIMKKELLRIPLFGHALAAGECIAIDRHNPNQATDFFLLAKEKLRSGLRLWIFPEGTRSRTGELLPFKTGGIRLAREIGAKIIPVGIVGTRHVLSPRSITTVDLHQHVELRMGEPIDATEYPTIEMQSQLLKRVQTAIAQLMR